MFRWSRLLLSCVVVCFLLMAKESVFQRGADDTEKIGRFVAGSSLALVATVLSGSMSFIWTIVMTRSLGPEGFGLVKPFLDSFWILCGAVSLGIPQAMQALISGYMDKSPQKARAVMADGSRMLFFIGLACCAIALIAAALFKHSFSPLMLKFIILLSAAVMARQMYFAFFGILGGLQRIDIVSTCNLVFPTSMLLSSSLFVYLAAKSGAPLETRVLAGVAGIPTAATIQYIFSLFIAPKSGVRLAEVYSWRTSHGTAVETATFGWVSSVAMVTLSIVSFIPPVVISQLAYGYGFFGGGAESGIQAGYFSGAFAYALAPMLIVGMFFALLPAISQAHADGNHALMQRYFTLASRYTSLVIIYVFAVYYVFAGNIVEIFSGSAFPSESLGTLTFLLATGMGFNMASVFFINLLIGMKRPAVAAIAGTIILATLPPALFIAAKKFDTISAEATAFATVSLGGAILLAILFRKTSRLTLPMSHFLRASAAAALTCAILTLLPGHSTIRVLSGIMASLPAYILLMGWTGGLNSSDYTLMEELLHSETTTIPLRIIKLFRTIATISPLFQSNR